MSAWGMGAAAPHEDLGPSPRGDGNPRVRTVALEGGHRALLTTPCRSDTMPVIGACFGQSLPQ